MVSYNNYGYHLEMETHQLLNPHLDQFFDTKNGSEPEWIDAKELISHQRLDLMAKYIYAEQRLNSPDLDYGRALYKAHLKAINNFKEGDQSGKVIYTDFENAFNSAIDSIERNGFDPTESLIPVDRRNIIIDGAHRVAACALLGKKVKITRFNFSTKSLGARELLNMGLNRDAVDALVSKYLSLTESNYVAVLFPIMNENKPIALSELNAIGDVFYEQKIALSAKGKSNLIRTLYHGEPWLSPSKQLSGGLEHHLSKRFYRKQNVVHFVFFQCDDIQQVLNAKDRIRNRIGLGNLPIHITDHTSEVRNISDVVLTNNGRHWLNNALYKPRENFDKLIGKYEQILSQTNASVDNYCLDSSATLGVYGLRDVSDLDYFVIGEDKIEKLEPSIDNHSQEILNHEQSIDSLINDPNQHVKIHGIKFISLDNLKYMKMRRNEAKDQNDILLIETLTSSNRLSLEKAIDFIATKFRLYKHAARVYLGTNLPPSAKRLVRAAYLLPRKLRDFLQRDNLAINIGQYEIKYNYKNRLIEDMLLKESYKPQLTSLALGILYQYDHSKVVHVNADVGFFAFELLNNLPRVSVIANEGNLERYEFLCSNINLNQLERVIFPDNHMELEPLSRGKIDLIVISDITHSIAEETNIKKLIDSHRSPIIFDFDDKYQSSIHAQILNAEKLCKTTNYSLESVSGETINLKTYTPPIDGILPLLAVPSKNSATS